MARHFRDLICWQLARALSTKVTHILKKPVFERHLRFRENLSDAASSVRRNIAEGFGRRGHKEFARFLNFSLASLKEVEDSLIESVDNKWLTDEEIAEAFSLCKRVTIATTRLRNSIKDKPDPPAVCSNMEQHRRTCRTHCTFRTYRTRRIFLDVTRQVS